MNINEAIEQLEKELEKIKEENDCHINEDDTSDMIRMKDMIFGKITGYESAINKLKNLDIIKKR